MTNFYIDPETGGIVPLPESEDIDFDPEENEELEESFETMVEDDVAPEEDQRLYPSAPTGLFLVDSKNVAGRYNLSVGFEESPTAVEYEVRVTKVS